MQPAYVTKKADPTIVNYQVSQQVLLNDRKPHIRTKLKLYFFFKKPVKFKGDIICISHLECKQNFTILSFFVILCQISIRNLYLPWSTLCSLAKGMSTSGW